MMNDALDEQTWNDAHPECIECGERGCLQDECPTSDSCDLPHAVVHCREPMHETCVAAFDRHVENRCDGTTCRCTATPEVVDADADRTCKTVVEPYESIASVAARRFALVAGLLLALGLGGACRATVPPPDTETVGQLAAGPSVYSAPLKHDAPPSLGFVAGSDDDNPGEVIATETRTDAAADAGAVLDAEVPEVTAKGVGLEMGSAR